MSNRMTFNLTRKMVLIILLAVPLALTVVLAHTSFATSGACTAPSTDYGTDTSTVSVPATGTYQIWTRMSAASSSANTYMLQIDGTSCYNIGGSTVPTYASGATTFFQNNTTNWIDKTTAGTAVDVSLTAGNHSFELIGNAAGVVVDRLVLTQDLTCAPTGTGDNCANPPDTTDPVVSITSPDDGTSLSGTTTISALATDNVAVKQVEFFVDNNLVSTQTTPTSANTYTYSLDPSTLSIGSHTVTAEAFDTASPSNTAMSSPITVIVPDTVKPNVSVTYPTSGATVSGTFTATVNATDNVGVKKVEYYLDNTTSGVPTTSSTVSPFSASINTASLSNGSHTIAAIAYDAAGNSKGSSWISFTVDNTAPPVDTTGPVLAITSPASGASISGTSTLSATASDPSGVASVAFYVDNTLKNSDDSTPFSYALDTTTLTNGSHTIKVVATDNSPGKNTTTLSENVTVSNVTYDPGDINEDGKVDLQDFTLLVEPSFPRSGTCASLGRADINCDGKVDLQDFTLLVEPKFPR